MQLHNDIWANIIIVQTKSAMVEFLVKLAKNILGNEKGGSNLNALVNNYKSEVDRYKNNAEKDLERIKEKMNRIKSYICELNKGVKEIYGKDKIDLLIIALPEYAIPIIEHIDLTNIINEESFCGNNEKLKERIDEKIHNIVNKNFISKIKELYESICNSFHVTEFIVVGGLQLLVKYGDVIFPHNCVITFYKPCNFYKFHIIHKCPLSPFEYDVFTKILSLYREKLKGPIIHRLMCLWDMGIKCERSIKIFNNNMKLFIPICFELHALLRYKIINALSLNLPPNIYLKHIRKLSEEFKSAHIIINPSALSKTEYMDIFSYITTLTHKLLIFPNDHKYGKSSICFKYSGETGILPPQAKIKTLQLYGKHALMYYIPIDGDNDLLMAAALLKPIIKVNGIAGLEVSDIRLITCKLATGV